MRILANNIGDEVETLHTHKPGNKNVNDSAIDLIKKALCIDTPNGLGRHYNYKKCNILRSRHFPYRSKTRPAFGVGLMTFSFQLSMLGNGTMDKKKP